MNNLIHTNTNRGREVSPLTAFDRLFEDMFSGLGMPLGLRTPTVSGFAPRMDIAETDKSYELTAELPGLSEKDVNVEVDGDVLTISGEKKNEYEEKGKDVYRMERSYGSFMRRFTLPQDVDAEKVDARFKDGVLSVSLPKTEQAKTKARKIAVKS